MADANSTQYGKLVSQQVQDLLAPLERHGRVRAAYFAYPGPSASAPSATEFGYLTKLPKGARVIGGVFGCEAGLSAGAGTCLIEVETGGTEASPTYSNASAAIDMNAGAAFAVDWTALALAGSPLTVTGQGRVRFNPGANTVAAKYLKGILFYIVD